MAVALNRRRQRAKKFSGPAAALGSFTQLSKFTGLFRENFSREGGAKNFIAGGPSRVSRERSSLVDLPGDRAVQTRSWPWSDSFFLISSESSVQSPVSRTLTSCRSNTTDLNLLSLVRWTGVEDSRSFFHALQSAKQRHGRPESLERDVIDRSHAFSLVAIARVSPLHRVDVGHSTVALSPSVDQHWRNWLKDLWVIVARNVVGRRYALSMSKI